MKAIYRIVLVGILSFYFPQFSWGIVPIEDVLLGSALEDGKFDPLGSIFKKINKTQTEEVRKLRSFYFKTNEAENLKNSCELYQGIDFASTWQEKQAQRSITSTLQWIGLEITSKAIGALANELQMDKTEFSRLSSNLVKNYCSKNISVISLKNLEEKLFKFFENPEIKILPSIKDSPYITKYFKDYSQGEEFNKRQLHYSIMNFRSFCSWGSDTEDFRLLAPYLAHPVIMAYVFKNLLNLEEQYDDKSDKIFLEPAKNSVQVICRELICRKTNFKTFSLEFPLSLGATALKTDLEKHYCFRFKQLNLSRNENKTINEWVKTQELEDTVFELAFFVSLLTGVPEVLFSLPKYADIPFLIKSSIDEKWDNWAKEVLSMFSKDLLFEESLHLKTIMTRDDNFTGLKSLKLKMFLTLGDLDQVLNEKDKFKLSFHLKVPKNYFIQMILKWRNFRESLNLNGEKEVRKEFAHYLHHQLELKEKKLLQKLWTKDVSRVLADEIFDESLKLARSFEGQYSSELISIPVEINYGLFAVSYLRYKADINAGRLKIK